MKVLVQTLTGKTTWEVTVGEEDTIAEMKTQVQGREGIEPEKQRYLYAGKALDDAKTVRQCGLKDGCVVKVVLVGIFRP